MTENTQRLSRANLYSSILFWGAIWGVFEATVGYALHLLPWSIGSYVWFPAAYWFMQRVYDRTHSRGAVAEVAVVSAGIKLFNLFTPMRTDYVINPAVSIVLEGLAMVAVLSLSQAWSGLKRPIAGTAARVLMVNTVWRLAYALYIATVVPAWMFEVSVLQSGASALAFFATDNLISGAVCFAVMEVYRRASGALSAAASSRSDSAATAPSRALAAVRYAAIGILLCGSVWLQIAL